MAMTDAFTIAGTALKSRLFVGSARYPNQQVMLDAMTASEPAMVTMSIRRISLEGYAESLVDLLGDRYRILPNTAGCATARDAMLTAQLAREALDTNWIKLELIGDRDLLYPDVEQLVHAAAELVREGFVVLPYCNEDPVACQKLADVGCAAVMPLGSLIGSGRGIANPAAIELICSRSPVPVVLDAGIGTASDAALAMELGCDAVMVDTAIAKSHDPVRMATAIKFAVEAGRLARLAGRIPKRSFAEPSSPQLGLVGS
jgi:thiazole synthase